jgi:hypothetical protein
VEAIRADTLGDITPGRRATKNFKRLVTGVNVEATIHASSQELPVGSKTPSKPS